MFDINNIRLGQTLLVCMPVGLTVAGCATLLSQEQNPLDQQNCKELLSIIPQEIYQNIPQSLYPYLCENRADVQKVQNAVMCLKAYTDTDQKILDPEQKTE